MIDAGVESVGSSYVLSCDLVGYVVTIIVSGIYFNEVILHNPLPRIRKEHSIERIVHIL